MSRRLALVAATALIIAAPADAALDTKLSISTREPRVGEWTTVYLRPYWPYQRSDGSCCRFVPADVRFPFRFVQALGPRGRMAFFKPRRTSDRCVWTARYRFPSAGGWRIRITNYYTGFCTRRGCEYDGPELVVRISG